MTPRERWQAAVSGKRPDRVPCDFWGTPEVTARLMTDLNCRSERELWERLGIDKLIFLAPRHPRETVHTWHIPSQFEVWHVGYKPMTYQGGTYVEDVVHPLAEAQSVADIEQFDWPDPDEWETQDVHAQCKEWADYPVIGATHEPFYLYCRLRGLQKALEDVAQSPDIAEALLEKICSIHEAIVRRVLEELPGAFDFILVAEDMGTQNSLLMSPAAFRRLLKPRMARMIDLIHSYGVKAFHHDDGAIRPLIPELLEIGIDVLNPIQWRCSGMQREELARDFGQAVVFHGAVDNQWTLPYGTVADVRREVAENIRIFKNCKGYIVAPCHNIQANTPTENIVALYQAAHQVGEA
jgi:uroporphyrinogen decarboxylase